MFYEWILFLCLIFCLLALDLGVFHKTPHKVEVKEAIFWSSIWIFLGLSFSAVVFYSYENHWFGLGLGIDPIDGKRLDGMTAAVKYFTGYVIEKSLSVDNIFVIAVIFQTLSIPPIYQHRILYWGILGALVMRGCLIILGSQLISQYHEVLYFFGLFLIFTSIKMMMPEKSQKNMENNKFIFWLKKKLSFTDEIHGELFWIRRSGKVVFTPLMLSLVLVESADLVFAVDSIPAIFSITGDPFLVFTSNVFAILGLRSLYFALASLIEKFYLLKLSLALILGIVGLKMIFLDQIKILFGDHFHFFLLGIIFLILIGGILASALYPKKTKSD